MEWLKSTFRRFMGWIKTCHGRLAAAVTALLGLAVASVAIGGVVASAALITMSVYIGTMITLNRMRKPPPENSGRVWRFVSWIPRAVSEFAFRHRLILTIVLGAVATWMIGMSTVTGVAVAALSAIAGDLLVSAFTDAANWLNSIGEENEGLEYSHNATQDPVQCNT